MAPREASQSAGTTVAVAAAACLALTEDYNLCPPPPISALNYKVNSSDSIILYWQYDEDAEQRKISFLLTFSLFPKHNSEQDPRHSRRDDCRETTRKNFEPWFRSAKIRVPPHRDCAFVAEMHAVDARNRRSHGTRVRSPPSSTRDSLSTGSSPLLLLGGVHVGLLGLAILLLAATVAAVAIVLRRRPSKAAGCRSDGPRWEYECKKEGDTLIRRVADATLPGYRYVQSPPRVEMPRSGIYRVGRGWSEAATTELCLSSEEDDGAKDASFSSRLLPDDGYAVCEYAAGYECQYDLALFPLPRPERMLYGLPAYDNSSFALLDVVGRGRFGSVHAARFTTGTMAAVKIFENPSCLVREVDVGRVLCHGHSALFPSLLAVASDAFGREALVYEYCPGGDLRRLLLSLGEDLPRVEGIGRATKGIVPLLGSFLRQVAMALSFLHCRSLVHRDVSARNVLLCLPWPSALHQPQGQTAKLGDIGLVAAVGCEGSSRELAIPWQSPQVREGAAFTPRDDVWSFGCLLLEVFSLGSAPFGLVPPSTQQRDQLKKAIGAAGCGHAKIDSHLSSPLRPLLSRCLAMERADRPSADVLVEEIGGRGIPSLPLLPSQYTESLPV